MSQSNKRTDTAARRWLLLPAAAAVVAVAAAGCAGAAHHSSSQAARTNAAVQTKGGELVNASGRTLYFADQEHGKTIRCTGSCTGIWIPATVGGSKAPHVNKALAAKLAVVKRPGGGKSQLSYAGHPLYRFRSDTAPGDAKGNGVRDGFGGRHFSWHAITPVGTAAKKAPSSGGGSGYGY